MRNWFPPTRRQLGLAHRGVTYRRYRCTGRHCNCEVIAIDRMHVECATPECRGQMKPRRIVPTAKVVDLQIERLIRRGKPENYPVEEPFSGVFLPETSENAKSDRRQAGEDLDGLEAEKRGGGFSMVDSPSGGGEDAS